MNVLNFTFLNDKYEFEPTVYGVSDLKKKKIYTFFFKIRYTVHRWLEFILMLHVSTIYAIHRW